MADEERTMQYTDLQLQFLNLIKKYPVKNPETIVDYVSSQGEKVLEEPDKLAVALSECEITPVRRKQILKHWFAEKGVEVPEELLSKVGLPPEERKKREEAKREEEDRQKEKYSVDEETGAITVATTSEKALTMVEAKELSKNIKKEIAARGKGAKVTYVYDEVSDKVRMAKEGEIGGTLEQAKELKKMAEEGKTTEEESPFIRDPEKGWILNPKARVTGVELMALESMRRAEEKGEPIDPVEALSQTAEKLKTYREAFGGGQAVPEWMTDPIKFIEAVQTITGGGKPDEGLKTEIGELRKTITAMQETQRTEQIENLRKANVVLAQKLDELTDYVTELKRPVTGRTEMDLLHDITSEGIGIVKTELPGLRSDVRELLTGGKLPPSKTPEQREERKQKIRQRLEADKEIDELGRKIFFPGH